MNSRERAWRRRVARMVRLLDERIAAGWEQDDFQQRTRLMEVRGRLAGSLGAEEGATSTPELRRRAALDHAEAGRLLGLDGGDFSPPAGHAVAGLKERDLASFRSAWPERGDRR